MINRRNHLAGSGAGVHRFRRIGADWKNEISGIDIRGGAARTPPRPERWGAVRRLSVQGLGVKVTLRIAKTTPQLSKDSVPAHPDRQLRFGVVRRARLTRPSRPMLSPTTSIPTAVPATIRCSS